MATPLDLLHQRGQAGLIGIDAVALQAIVHHTLQTLHDYCSTHSLTHPPTLLLSESDPCHILASFTAACSFPCTIALCNPTWAETEWLQVVTLLQPNVVLGRKEEIGEKPAIENLEYPSHSPSPLSPQPLILIPTGGSSGKIRFAMHTWETLMASVIGFQQHFQVERINSLCVLPLYHVSGLMQFLRSLLTGGTFAIVPFKSLQAGALPELPDQDFFLSLVPTQLARLLRQENNLPSWLLSTRDRVTILLGGAPAWDDVLAQARRQHIRLAPTYGMTETAAQIATQLPEAFLQGRSGYPVLPHAQVTIRDEAGNPLAPHQVGRIAIAATSLMLGYFPQMRDRNEFLTDDMGYLDESGALHVLGRRDGIIISGGENIVPIEVESAIWASGLVTDVCVVGVPDAEWGQAVTAVYVPVENIPSTRLQAAIARSLSRYKHPKRWIAVAELPRNAQGKVNRHQVMKLLSPLLDNSLMPSEQNRAMDGAIASLHQCIHAESSPD